MPSAPPPPDMQEKYGDIRKTHELSNDYIQRATVQEIFTPTNLESSPSFQKPVELEDSAPNAAFNRVEPSSA